MHIVELMKAILGEKEKKGKKEDTLAKRLDTLIFDALKPLNGNFGLHVGNRPNPNDRYTFPHRVLSILRGNDNLGDVTIYFFDAIDQMEIWFATPTSPLDALVRTIFVIEDGGQPPQKDLEAAVLQFETSLAPVLASLL